MTLRLSLSLTLIIVPIHAHTHAAHTHEPQTDTHLSVLSMQVSSHLPAQCACVMSAGTTLSGIAARAGCAQTSKRIYVAHATRACAHSADSDPHARPRLSTP